MALLIRELPAEEWQKLRGTELEHIVITFKPLTGEWPTVIVVEDDDEQIVGCWALVRNVLHVEGCWIRPDYRKGGGVARKLLTLMRELWQREPQPVALAGVDDEDVANLLTEHLGAKPLPGRCYAIPTRRP